MKLKPLADRIVIRREAAESKSFGGIILPEAAQKKPQRGTIVAVGPGKLNKKTGLYEQNVSVLNLSNTAIPNITYVLDNMTGGTVYINDGYTQFLAPLGSPVLGQYSGVTVLLQPGNTMKVKVIAFDTTGNITYTPRVLAGYGAR